VTLIYALIAPRLYLGAFLTEGSALGSGQSPDEKDASGRKPEAIIVAASGYWWLSLGVRTVYKWYILKCESSRS
jgi:hypothetical protein